MAKMTFDTTGVDPSSTTGFPPYEGEVPRPGTYWATIRSAKIVNAKSSGNPMIKVLYVLAGDDKNAKKNEYKGAPLFDNVVPGEHELQQIRLSQFLRAVSGKQKAVIDHDNIDEGGKINKVGGKDPVGTQVKIVIQADSYNGERTARVSDVFPVGKGDKFPTGDVQFEAEEPEAEEDAEDVADVAEEEAEGEEPESDEEAEEEAEEAEPEGEEEEEDGEDDPRAARAAELADLDRTKLKAALKASGSDLKVLKSTTDDAIREAILDAEFVEEEAEEEDTAEYDARVEELAGMDRTALKAELKEADPEFKVLKKHTDDDLRAAILGAEFEAAEGEDEGSDEPPF